MLKKGSIFKIVKEPDNSYDMEAIAVKYSNETIAYIANSVNTVERSTMSAGRIYDKFNNDCEIEIIFAGCQIIAKLLISWEDSVMTSTDEDIGLCRLLSSN